MATVARCWYRAIGRLESLTFDVVAFEGSNTSRKIESKLDELICYIDRNRAFIVDYGDRFRHGDSIATGLVESAVHQVVSKQFVKRQQMSGTMSGADRTLQLRTAVLNDELREHVER